MNLEEIKIHEKQKNLLRLIRILKENKSPIVQEFIKEVTTYVNETEHLISELEMGITQLMIKHNREEDLKQQKLNEILEMIAIMTAV